MKHPMLREKIFHGCVVDLHGPIGVRAKQAADRMVAVKVFGTRGRKKV